MLPGKKFTSDDIVRILTRRAWIVVLSLAICGGGAFAVSKRLPNQYRSETLIMVIPQRISETYVRAQPTAKIEDRLNTLEDQILSRSRLERIILDLKLYPALRQKLPMEDVVQRMRDDINVKVEGKESFRIQYVSQESKTAQLAAERLAGLFIEESIRDRENVAEDTNQFLEAQLEDAKRRLQMQEKKLEEYKNRYGGELPAQVATNLQAIQNAQVQLQTLNEAGDRASERRLLIERQIADLQDNSLFVPVPLPQPAAPDPAPATEPASVQLQRLQTALEQARTRYTDDHPNIRTLKRRIAEAEAKVAEEKARPAVTEKQALIELPPVERARQQRIRELKLQIEDIDRQIGEKKEQEKRLHALVAEYQAKLDAAPKRESDLVELTRDYTTLQASYQSLLTKREEAKLNADLQRRNIGEQFKVLDPARAPERPFSPNRLLIDVGGAGTGFFLGLLIIGLLEYRDSSFKSEEDVVRVLNLRVLALVPVMASDAERKIRKWRLALFAAAFIVVAGSASTALVLWRLRH
jgi:polysaccharide chain length determinant protein (PEP-CTERM system associated)